MREYHNTVTMYKSAMAQAKAMLLKGVINEGEYAVIEANMCEKYGIGSCSLFRTIDWISPGYRGNMSSTGEVA